MIPEDRGEGLIHSNTLTRVAAALRQGAPTGSRTGPRNVFVSHGLIAQIRKRSRTMEFGILGLIVLALDIYAIYHILTSGASTLAKVIWTIVILLLPVIGFIAWLIAGPRGGNKAHV
jgi:hypothetical protein